MRINTIRYMIVTKDNPILFMYGNGNLTESIETAIHYYSFDEAENYRNLCDEPDIFKVVKLEISYLL